MTLEVGSGGKKQQWTWIRKTSNPILATDPQCDHWVRCSAFLNLDCHNSLGRGWHSDQQAWLVEMLEWGFMWKGQAWHLIGSQSIGIYKETFPRKTIKNKQEEKKEKNLKEKKKKGTSPYGHLYPHSSSFYTHASSSWTSGSLISCFGSEQKGTQVSVFPQLEHLWDQKGETIKFLLTSAWIHTDTHRQRFFIEGTWKEDFKRWQNCLFKDKFRGSEGTQATILHSSLLSGIIFLPGV